MHTEQRFMQITRDYSNSMLSFTTPQGQRVNMKFFCEKKSETVNSAHVYVHKATILQPQSYSLVKSTLRNKRVNSEKLMVLNGIEDINFATPDLVFSSLLA